MQTIPSVVLIVFIVIFVATAALALLAVARFGPRKTSLVTIDSKYLWPLFTALLLETVGLVLALGSVALDGIRSSSADLNDSSKRIEELLGTLDDMTRHMINEPSGIVAFSDQGQLHGIIVDDEEPDLILVGPVKDDLLYRRTIPIKDLEPVDIEAITYDGAKWFYATTSFRQLGEEGKPARKLMRFELDADWHREDYQVVAESRDVAAKLQAFLQKHGVTIEEEAWRHRADAAANWHPWQLEVEGAAVREGRLVLGLKWPLTSNNEAILVEYSWADGEFAGFHQLDLQGHGVSDLCYESRTGRLVVASNPPAKERRENLDDERAYLGNSLLRTFSWKVGQPQLKLESTVSAAQRRAKLEGVAVTEKEVWLTYDGPNHQINRMPIGILSKQ
ncbi:MAG: hypothetical protein AAF581_02060 [Planctomycetota bacterium]